MRLVHLTDPHLSSLDGVEFSSLRGKRWSGFVSWHHTRCKRYLPTVLERLCVAVRAENADQILLTGDLVQIGLDTEIIQAADWLGRLGPAEQVMLVPGNHDIYAPGSAQAVGLAWVRYLYNGIGESDSDELNRYPVLRKLGKLSLIGLSTACVTPVFLATGKLGQNQLERLADLLRQAASEQQLVCLLIHHPPLPGMTKWRRALADADALQTVLQRYPPLLMFHGHLHHNQEQHWGNARIYCTAAASSVSDASYRVIDIEDRGDSWSFRMTLRSIVVGRELKFVVLEKQAWQVAKTSVSTGSGDGSRQWLPSAG